MVVDLCWLCCCSCPPELAGGFALALMLQIWQAASLCVCWCTCGDWRSTSCAWGKTATCWLENTAAGWPCVYRRWGRLAGWGVRKLALGFTRRCIYIYMRCCARWAWAEGCCLGQAMLNLTGPYIIVTGIYYLRVYGYVVVCTRTHTRHTDG